MYVTLMVEIRSEQWVPVCWRWEQVTAGLHGCMYGRGGLYLLQAPCLAPWQGWIGRSIKCNSVHPDDDGSVSCCSTSTHGAA